MLDNYYQELELPHIIPSLNRVVETIAFDPNKVDHSLYKLRTTKEHAQSRVSEAILLELQEKGDRQVATEDCSLYKFNNIQFNTPTKLIGETFKGKVKDFGLSGRIWYPVNGFMGWHSNSNNQGHRLYCTFAREGNKAFFRYQDPVTKEIVTSWDKEGWNFRMFKIDKNLWHCVYSETDRISIGYALYL